jgi:hypothetical protein
MRGDEMMKVLLLSRLRRLRVSLVVFALLFVPNMVQAQEMVTVPLDPVASSGVSGTATLRAAEEGTNITLDLQGLAPDAIAQGILQAGTCDMPSASAAALPSLQADAAGQATATGAVLFRGTEPVALATIADGAHVITIQTEQAVACGVIPQLTAASGPPTQLPVTGSAASPFMSVSVVVFGVAVLAAGLSLWRYRRSLRRF